MSLMLSAVRVRNFRSLAFADFSCNSSSGTVLIGANNVGKTAFLSALRLVFDPRFPVSSEDVYRAPGDLDAEMESREAIVDVLITPTNLAEDGALEFTPEWQLHFGRFISLDENSNQSVSIRAKIVFNRSKGEYEVERRILLDWPDSKNLNDYVDYNKILPRESFFEPLPVFYLDARRDIVADMRDKFSYFARLVKDIKIDQSLVLDFEKELESINSKIVDESDILKHLTDKLGMISKTLDSEDSKILIHPVTQKLSELGKNLTINFQDEHSDAFSMSNHGMGTRSWITFLTLFSYVDWQIGLRQQADKCYYPIVLLEEPEAHLHPNSQRNIYKQMKSLSGQIFVSTHSPSIVSQTDLIEILFLTKKYGKTTVKSVNDNLMGDELRKIKQEILKSRGELLFSEALILCEGETEEQSIPTFFKEKFKKEIYECGFNVISVNGYGKYKPFLKFAKVFDIPVYIFSDGEKIVKESIENVIEEVFGESSDDQKDKTVFLPMGDNFERYLVSENYDKELVQALEAELGEGVIENYIKTKNGTFIKRKPTKDTCSCCGQKIFSDRVRDYPENDAGYKKALLDCLKDNKTAYSFTIADNIILKNKDTGRAIPNKLLELFVIINNHHEILKEKI